MNFKSGLNVSVRHYSDLNLHMAVILESNYDKIKVQFPPNKDFLNFRAGDPLAIGFEIDNLVYISSCSIQSIDAESKQIVLITDSIETLANKRLFERFPSSFLANVKIGSSKIEHQLQVKNISFNGMLACSQIDFPLYQEVKMEFDIGSLVFLKAVIIRKSKELHAFEYGLKLVYTDPTTPSLIKRYLQDLKKEQEEYITNCRDIIEK